MKTDLTKMNITISQIVPGDELEFYKLIDDNREHLKNMRWAETATLFSTKEYLDWLLENTDKEHFRFIMVDGKIAGCLTLRLKSAGVYEIGFWIGNKYRRQGVVTTAVRIMLLTFPREYTIYAHIRQTNTGSMAVLKLNGFQFVDYSVIDEDVWQHFVRHSE